VAGIVQMVSVALTAAPTVRPDPRTVNYSETLGNAPGDEKVPETLTC
jgi:hypothetical protein